MLIIIHMFIAVISGILWQAGMQSIAIGLFVFCALAIAFYYHKNT